MSNELGMVKYDAMCKAITSCYRVDEVKEIRSRARALEVYAKQGKNHAAEQRAREVRIRAERQAGKLLIAMERSGERQKPQRPKRSHDVTVPQKSKTLTELGLSKNESAKWQALAKVPDEQFECSVKEDGVHTETIIAKHRGKPLPLEPMPKVNVSDAALWLWGRMMDFERDHLLAKNPNDLIDQMPDHMRTDMNRLLPMVHEWLGRAEVIRGTAKLDRTA